MPKLASLNRSSGRSKASTPRSTAIGRDLIEAASEALTYYRGDVALETRVVPASPGVDVKAIRRRLKLSQAQFAGLFRFNPRTVQEWEQGRSTPDSAVRAYLTVIDRDPAAVRNALAD
ncbi:MAG: helix-turn-helix domain-containing protein [Acidobacteria bacterium]|nr:helix-turn-helix domain-containing protein [Acidobacteriota bacterium]